MPKFFISPSAISGDTACLTGDSAAHITRSLRMSAGESITLCDGEGLDYFCKIKSVGNEVILTVENTAPSTGEPPYRVTVYQALSKGDRFDTVVQKSVECGAFAIVPVQTERATVRLNREDCRKKSVRWQKIAQSAAEQCGRGTIPQIAELMSFSEAVASAENAELALFCYENEDGRTLGGILAEFADRCRNGGTPPEIAVIIGPEGGFSKKEAELVRRSESPSLRSVSLGTRILRTESAAPFVLACLSMALEM